ncbi:MAG TPA: DUF480 domain-containing protein [Phycisphaerae bacterium]|jgi:hypothetical protein
MPEPLTALQCRIMGVLIEKSLTTPEQYPLSANALAAGSSQKSNRDPLMEVDENAALDTVGRLRKLELVELANLSTGRVNRWKHRARDAWNVERPQLAILAELLLRGPQTLGELRTRAARMYPFESMEVVQATLEPLMHLPDPLVATHPPAPGGRAGRFRHTFYDQRELAALDAALRAIPAAAPATPEGSASFAELQQALAALQARVETIERRIEQMQH